MFSYKKTAIITITILTILHTENVCDKTFVFCFQVVPSFIYYFPGYGQLKMKNNFFFLFVIFFLKITCLSETRNHGVIVLSDMPLFLCQKSNRKKIKCLHKSETFNRKTKYFLRKGKNLTFDNGVILMTFVSAE